MRSGPPSSRSPNRTSPQIKPRPSIRTPILRFAVAGLLGVTTAVLISCGSSSKGLIPAANAGPLQSDFEAVSTDAHNGNGNCSATEAAIFQTEHDFSALPANVDAGLHARLRAGIKNLRERALELCAQPSPQATATSTSPRTTTRTQTTSTTPTVTQTTSSQTAPTTTAPTTTGTGGGTPAPSENGGAAGPSNGGGGAGPGGGQEQGAGAGAGGQEGGR